MHMRNFVLAVAVFLVVLVALTFGETVLSEVFSWVAHLTGLVIHNFSDLYHVLTGFLRDHGTKVIIALILTVPITLWIVRHEGNKMERSTNRRKVAIILAFCLGWIGIHRFYLNQIGVGLLYMLVFYIFAPLAVVLGLIDGIRYILMSDEDFHLSTTP